ncbi:DUF4179 domain-containing protein [Caproiciproducens sp. NJN-50]|nr:DUF4179 domain-containing protein [Caproiciproducens sp. NJN-50]
MFSEEYRHMIDQVHPNDELLCHILESAHSGKEKKSKTSASFRKPVIAVIAVCICMSLSVPVLAEKVEPVYQLMYTVSPELAQFFMPVQKSDEDNGIKMEVASACIRGNAADIYITMQDLTGDRIDGTTDLNDSYSINRPFSSLASCQRVGYDQKTKTATFLISITEWGNQKIAGDKITFSVGEFISGKKDYEDIRVPVDLSSAATAKNIKKVDSTGGSGKDYEKYIVEGKTTALTPSRAMDGFPVEGIELTGIGYIGGKLHIQTAVYDNLDKDNHGYFYLKDADGSIVDLDYAFSFLNQFQQPGRIDYDECVFDVPQKKIGNYILYGSFVTSSMHTEGNWRVTFPLKQAEAS